MDMELTELVFVLDESGSMNSVRYDTIGGFNRFIEDQKKIPGKANITLITFNSDSIVKYFSIPIENLKPLTAETYMPGGMTALYDAVGMGIDKLGKKLSETPEEKRPSKVLFVILTDGEENHSKEYTIHKIQEMIKHQTEVYNWEFMFLGANINVQEVSRSINIKPSNAMAFATTQASMENMYSAVSRCVSNYRVSTNPNPNLTIDTNDVR